LVGLGVVLVALGFERILKKAIAISTVLF
jgi:hypothetical protein